MHMPVMRYKRTLPYFVDYKLLLFSEVLNHALIQRWGYSVDFCYTTLTGSRIKNKVDVNRKPKQSPVKSILKISKLGRHGVSDLRDVKTSNSIHARSNSNHVKT